jgi:hypothetical protein
VSPGESRLRAGRLIIAIVAVLVVGFGSPARPTTRAAGLTLRYDWLSSSRVGVADREVGDPAFQPAPMPRSPFVERSPPNWGTSTTPSDFVIATTPVKGSCSTAPRMTSFQSRHQSHWDVAQQAQRRRRH